MADRDSRIRARAYELWEKAGKPAGRHDEHWSEAERQVMAEETATGNPAMTDAGQTAKPKRKPAAAKSAKDAAARSGSAKAEPAKAPAVKKPAAAKSSRKG